MKVPEEGLQLLLKVSKRSIRKYFKHDNMTSHAAALAYRALFALVPFLALLVALPWFLGIGDFFTQWLSDQTTSALLGQTAELVEGWIKQSQFQTQGGRLSIGIVTISIAIWSVSSGVRTLTKALNVVHEVEESRPGWKRYGLSFFYALGLAIMVILATALLLIGPRVVERIVGLVGLEGGVHLFVDVATPPGRARSAHALRVHRLLGIPERELFVPARHPRCRSRRNRLGFSLAGFLVLPVELRQLQRGLRQPGRRLRVAPLLLHLGGSPAVWRRGERGDAFRKEVGPIAADFILDDMHIGGDGQPQKRDFAARVLVVQKYLSAVRI